MKRKRATYETYLIHNCESF